MPKAGQVRARKPAKRRAGSSVQKVLTPAAYAKHAGISRQTLMRQIELGQLGAAATQVGKRWQIDRDAADRARAANLELRRDVPTDRPGAQGKGTEGAAKQPATAGQSRVPTLTLTDAKTLTEESKAEIEYLRLLELQGKMLPADQVRRDRFQLGRMVRDAVLAIPARISSELMSIKDENEFQIYLKACLVEALESLVEEQIGGAA